MMGSDSQPAVLDQRGQIRFVVRLEAKVFPGGLPCLLLDISNRGARLHFPHAAQLPAQVVVAEWNSGRAYECRVAWQSGLEAGVEFLDTASLLRPAPPVFAAARTAWQGCGDRAATTFTVRRQDRQWAVTISGPALGEPAVIGVFLKRWQAHEFARGKAEMFDGRSSAATC